MLTLQRAFLDTPLGPMLALASDEGLCALEFHAERRHVRLDARLKRWFPPHEIVDGRPAFTEITARWLAGYFAGDNAVPPDVPLDLRGAPFELQVWRALRTIPAGSTASYGAIARTVGSPDASRAVERSESGFDHRSMPSGDWIGRIAGWIWRRDREEEVAFES